MFWLDQLACSDLGRKPWDLARTTRGNLGGLGRDLCVDGFGCLRASGVHLWQQTLQAQINVAVKARQAVRVSRLELDAAKQALKTASPSKQEHARLDVENAEDDLVQKTEVAITLMKAVLDNPEPIKNLNELVKAQLRFYTVAAETLSSVQGEIEELSVAAEGDYRKSRDH
jgi:hypothetical protein